MTKMLIIGLTGSIGMGKSTAAKILRGHGFPIYSADEAVHSLLKKGGRAVNSVAKLAPESFIRGAIDRKTLGQIVFANPKKLRSLEKILHPLIADIERAFLKKARKAKARVAILEIPLLFETGGEKRCDYTFCVTAPASVQRARVLARPRMTEQKFKAILKAQMSDAQKRKLADFVIPTGKGLADVAKHLDEALKELGVSCLDA